MIGDFCVYLNNNFFSLARYDEMARKRKAAKRKVMKGGGFLDTLHKIVKDSGIISTAIGQIPVIGGFAGKAVRSLTGYGRKRRMRGRGVSRVIRA